MLGTKGKRPSEVLYTGSACATSASCRCRHFCACGVSNSVLHKFTATRNPRTLITSFGKSVSAGVIKVRLGLDHTQFRQKGEIKSNESDLVTDRFGPRETQEGEEGHAKMGAETGR